MVLQDQHKDLPDSAEDETSVVAVAGRVMAKRVLGKLAFLSITDDRGTIQVRQQRLCGGWEPWAVSCTW